MKSLSQRRILLVGGAGTIGRALTSVFKQNGAKISWLTRQQVSSPQEVEILQWSDPRTAPWKNKSFDSLVVATNTPLNKSFPKSGRIIFDTHVTAPIYLADWAVQSGINHFIYFSTGSIYEVPQSASQIDFKKPPEFFISAKIATEKFLQNYHSCFTVQIIRLFRPYGPLLHESLINRMVKTLLDQKEIHLTSPDGPCIQPIYITDLCHITAKLLTIPHSSVIDLAGKERLRLGELLRRAAVISQINASIKILDQPSIDDTEIRQSGLKEIDSLITTSVNEGLKSLIHSFR